MSRDVTLCNVFCNLSRNSDSRAMLGWVIDWELFSNSEFLLAAQQKYCETSCKSGITLCNV